MTEHNIANLTIKSEPNPEFREAFQKLSSVERVDFLTAILQDAKLSEQFAIATGAASVKPQTDLSGIVPQLVLSGGIANHEEIVAEHNKAVAAYVAEQEELRRAYEEKYRPQYDMTREITRQVLTPIMTKFLKEIKDIVNPPKVSFWTKVKNFFGVK